MSDSGISVAFNLRVMKRLTVTRNVRADGYWSPAIPRSINFKAASCISCISGRSSISLIEFCFVTLTFSSRRRTFRRAFLNFCGLEDLSATFMVAAIEAGTTNSSYASTPSLTSKRFVCRICIILADPAGFFAYQQWFTFTFHCADINTVTFTDETYAPLLPYCSKTPSHLFSCHTKQVQFTTGHHQHLVVCSLHLQMQEQLQQWTKKSDPENILFVESCC